MSGGEGWSRSWPLTNLPICLCLSFPLRSSLGGPPPLQGIGRHPKSLRSDNITNKGIIDVIDGFN